MQAQVLPRAKFVPPNLISSRTDSGNNVIFFLFKCVRKLILVKVFPYVFDLYISVSTKSQFSCIDFGCGFVFGLVQA